MGPVSVFELKMTIALLFLNFFVNMQVVAELVFTIEHFLNDD